MTGSTTWLAPLDARFRKRSLWPWMLVPFWTFMAMVMSGLSYFTMLFQLQKRPFTEFVAQVGAPVFAWSLLTPIIAHLARRYPIQRPRVLRNLLVHLGAVLASEVVFVGVLGAIGYLQSLPQLLQMPEQWFARALLSGFSFCSLAYFGTAGACHAVDYFTEARRREAEAHALTLQLAEARMSALQAQLHPHFLFNTLNAVAVLARDDDMEAVRRMIMLLASLLRDVLHSGTGHMTTLEREVSFARRYLEIQQVRYGERLRSSERIPAMASGVMVPVFLLQPIVENAIRHGLGSRVTGGTISLEADVRDGILELSVGDDGNGLPDDWAGEEDYGMGLSNTAARLAGQYGAAASLTVEKAPGGGTCVRIRIPVPAGA